MMKDIIIGYRTEYIGYSFGCHEGDVNGACAGITDGPEMRKYTSISGRL